MRFIISVFFVIGVFHYCSFAFGQLPTVDWVNSHGSTLLDIGYSIDTDINGDIVVAGMFNEIVDFDPGAGVSNETSNGGYDVMIQKLDDSGSLLWSMAIGGSYNDVPRKIITDGIGNIYVAGYFRGTVDFDPGLGVFNLTSNGIDDVFILKLTGNGDFLWAYSIGGNANDYCFGLAFDSTGNLYLAGTYSGLVDFDPSPAVNNMTSVAGSDGFIQKVDTTGSLIWVKSIGGNGPDIVSDIAISQNGDVICCGYFESACDLNPSVDTNYQISEGNSDAFVLKLDSLGNYLWSRSLGGTEYDYAQSIVTGNGKITLVGWFRDIATVSQGGNQIISNGGNDYFVWCLNDTGDTEWIDGYGYFGDDFVGSVEIDAFNNIYTTGHFSGTVDFDHGSGTFNLSAPDQDVYVQKLDTQGNLLWATSLGAGGDDYGRDFAIDCNGKIYLTGYYYSNFELGQVSIGNGDIFTAKLSQCYIDNSINLSGDTISSLQSGANYQWLDCSSNFQPIIGENNQEFITTSNGEYAVEINLNGCIDTSDCILFNSADVLNLKKKAIKIYPNPFYSSFLIEGDDLNSINLLRITNTYGELVYRASFEHSNIPFEVTVESLPVGFMVIEFVYYDGSSSRHALIKI